MSKFFNILRVVQPGIALLSASLWCPASTVEAREDPAAEVVNPGLTLETIAFGSCAKQDMDQPIWEAVIHAQPDLWLFMGDNVYADTTDEAEMRKAYDDLAQKSGWQKLRSQTPVLAIWDDHDYGANDAGAEFEGKEMAQRVFYDFFQVPATEPRRNREGLYGSYLYGEPGKQVKIILLDTRWFRAPLTRGQGERNYAHETDPSRTMLGERQWRWLEKELATPGDLTLVVSSIQVLPLEHGWEKWQNLVPQREKLLRMIRDSQAPGVILLSGDRHLAEITLLPADQELGPRYPLYEVTASSMNLPLGRSEEINSLRVGENYVHANFGTIEIDWDEPGTPVALQIRGIEGRVRREVKTNLAELRP
jgi:alkaline phosphatase D